MIELYTAATPNGYKASIVLEELGLPYTLHSLDFGTQQQKSLGYLKLNPNGRIPTIVDEGFAVFESGAILIYLAEKTGKLMPTDAKGRSEVIQWLMFQMGGVGPMQGQANVFFRYWHEKYQPAIDRYQKETRRLYEVLDTRLKGRDWLCGPGTGDYSIADIAHFPWVNVAKWAGVETTGLDALEAWVERVRARPAVQRGLAVPPRTDSATLVKAAQSMLAR